MNKEAAQGTSEDVMIQPLEPRRLLHFAYAYQGVLYFPGAEELDDVLTVQRFDDVYTVSANDGFTKDIPVSEVTVGININGGGGNDEINIDSSVRCSTTLIGAAGNDTINGGAGKDDIQGNDGNDLLLGNGNRDLIDGGAGNDTLSGGGKNDTLTGGEGADSIIGSLGTGDVVDYSDHTLAVNVSFDGTANDGSANEQDNITETCEYIYGGSGNDFIRSNGKPNYLQGGAGNDTLIGGSGNDTLVGNGGNDSLEGQAGNDSIFAQDSEKDTLSGGSGTDTATYDAADILNSIP